MRKRYSRSYTVLSFLTMFSYREQPYASFFFLPRIPNLWLIVIPHCLPYNGIRWREVPSERGAAASGLRRGKRNDQEE